MAFASSRVGIWSSLRWSIWLGPPSVTPHTTRNTPEIHQIMILSLCPCVVNARLSMCARMGGWPRRPCALAHLPQQLLPRTLICSTHKHIHATFLQGTSFSKTRNSTKCPVERGMCVQWRARSHGLRQEGRSPYPLCPHHTRLLCRFSSLPSPPWSGLAHIAPL